MIIPSAQRVKPDGPAQDKLCPGGHLKAYTCAVTYYVALYHVQDIHCYKLTTSCTLVRFQVLMATNMQMATALLKCCAVYLQTLRGTPLECRSIYTRLDGATSQKTVVYPLHVST